MTGGGRGRSANERDPALCDTQRRPFRQPGDARISATSPHTPDRLVVLGYIAAVSIPPIGFVLALVIAFRKVNPNLKHALFIFTLGLVACVLWAVVIASGALTATDSSF